MKEKSDELDKLTYEEYARWRETHKLNTRKTNKEYIISEENVVAETLRIAKILKENGVDLSKIQLAQRIDRKQIYILLEDIEQDGIDIQKIIKENELDGKFKYGYRLRDLRAAYNGVGSCAITEAQKREAEGLGLISKYLMDKEKQRQEAVRKNQQAKELCSEYEQLLRDRDYKYTH